MISLWQSKKRLAYGEAALVPMAVTTSWRKCLCMNRYCSSGWFQIIYQLCGDSGNLGVGCPHVNLCSAVQILCYHHALC